MKKTIMALVCMVFCFTMLTGCTVKKEGEGQNTDLDFTVEADVRGEAYDGEDVNHAEGETETEGAPETEGRSETEGASYDAIYSDKAGEDFIFTPKE